MSIKFLVLGGGVFWVFCGGGADFIFMGARIFLIQQPDRGFRLWASAQMTLGCGDILSKASVWAFGW